MWGELMEHLSPSGSAGGAAGSSNNAGLEATATPTNSSVHQHADINPQAGSAAVDESSSTRFIGVRTAGFFTYVLADRFVVVRVSAAFEEAGRTDTRRVRLR